jgi:hypothetical protein
MSSSKLSETCHINKVSKGLKFKNRNGVIYHNADWIAGVDYDDPDDCDPDDIENEDEEYDNGEDEEEETED